jgi:hypothetical protein
LASSEQTRIRTLATVPLNLRRYGGFLSFKTYVFSTFSNLCHRKRRGRDHTGNCITMNTFRISRKLYISTRKLQLFPDVEFITVPSPARIHFSPPPCFSLVRPLLRSSVSITTGSIGKPISNSPGQGLRFPGGWGSLISRQSAHECSKVSLTQRPSLPPPTPINIPGTHFC